MFKGLSNLATLMRQLPQLGPRMQQMQEMQAQLQHERVTGSAGGGLVEVEFNGLGEMLRLKIDPALLAKQDAELLESLVPAAVNQAQAKVKQLSLETMSGALEIPGLDEALKHFTGGDSPPGSSP